MKNKVFILSIMVLLSCGKKQEKQIIDHPEFSPKIDTQDYHIKELDKILSLGDSAMQNIKQKEKTMKKVNDRMSHQIENANHLVNMYRDSIYKIESEPNICKKCLEMQKRNIVIKDSIIYNVKFVDTIFHVTDTIYDTVHVTKKVLKKKSKKNKK